jgi:hypothetical protein
VGPNAIAGCARASVAGAGASASWRAAGLNSGVAGTSDAASRAVESSWRAAERSCS